MKKHLFLNSPNSAFWCDRDRCKRCGYGKTNHRHLNPSIYLLFSWLHSKTYKA